jgi:TRAP transporter TAXI family solute receptor
MSRLVRTGLVLVGLMLAAAAVLMGGRQGSAQPARQSFDILTGSAGGSYFPVGELIARVISHPPGLARCERSGVCAPPGIIVSARSSDGAIANVLTVNQGSATSGLAQAPVVAEAVAGRGVFRKQGRQTHIRVMAELFSECLLLVARPGIDSLADLRGKRVSLGSEGSGGDVIAAEALSAVGVRTAQIRRDGVELSAGRLRQGQIDAFFYLSSEPLPVVADLLARGAAHVVSLDDKTQARVLSRIPGLSSCYITPGLYRGTGPINAVAARTFWITNESAPAGTVYGLVRALYNPANRDLLAQGPRPAEEIQLHPIMGLGVVTLHPGAARFYRETGQLPPPARTQRH